MVKKKTLISFIGKGQIQKDSPFHTYLKAMYDFNDGYKVATSCFAEAIRRCGKYEFDEVLFIGSSTSSWGTLLEDDRNSEDLYLELYERSEKDLPLGDKEEELKLALEALWQKPVRLCVNEPELTPENSEEILYKYIGVLLASQREILLDITHGYRWMPVLLTSVLQIANAYQNNIGGKIEVVYGELRRNADSPVRCLDILIKGQEIADAIALFFQKFEAEPLVELLMPHWEGGAKAIKKFALNIQGNYFLPLLIDLQSDNFPVGKIVKNLKNELDKFTPASQPSWVIHVHRQLKKIVKELLEESAVQRLLNLAELLASRHYYGQAILLVCLAEEQTLIETMGCRKHPGFDGVKYLKDVFIDEEKKNKKTEKNPYIGYFLDIKNLRNRIAHGGLPDSGGTGGIPQAESLKDQYESILHKQQKLYPYLTKNFRVPPEVERLMRLGEKPWLKKS